MTIANKQETLILLVGDIIFFLIALWITLGVRYAEIPSRDLFYNHVIPFSFLFMIWVVVYFISGLYDKHTILFRNKLSSIILNAQGVNIILAALFFFFIPYFDIAPKTNLVLYLVISSLLVLVWRISIFPKIGFRRKQKAVLIGYKSEVRELVEEVNSNPRYSLEFVCSKEIDENVNTVILQDEIVKVISSGRANVVVVDIKSRKLEGILTSLYDLSSAESTLTFIDIHKIYEDIFDRIPMSALNESWILEHISFRSQKLLYNVGKRSMDVVGSLLLGVLLVILYPLVLIAIKIEDGGPIFIRQQRVGKDEKRLFVYKFRTMRFSDSGDAWVSEKGKNAVTTVGTFLRKTSIDEFPQCLNVFMGSLSLVGPRSDIVGIHERLKDDIAHNELRYSVTPGMSGWAQIKQQYEEGHLNPQSIHEMKTRLSYDLFYIKNQSLFLDVIIAMQTLRSLLFGRVGV